MYVQAATGNKMMGKGFEKMENYRNCILEFMKIDNIHAIRGSMEKYVPVIRIIRQDLSSIFVDISVM